VPIELSGFTVSEVDQILMEDQAEAPQQGPLEPDIGAVAIARVGDIFQLGPHRLICGDATDPAVLGRLMLADPAARLILSDEPYNVKITGHVTGGAHREFAMASGEMTEEEFLLFNMSWIEAALPHLCDGGVFGTFIDWRGAPIVSAAAAKLGLTPLNLIVWAKTNAGMGSLYRSQHELLPLYKKGDAPHVNNVELGRSGRWRSNVWTYPGASSLGSDARRGLKDHPTVKPVAMLADALLDLTQRGEIVLDPFFGSGSTLIAAHKTGRVCRGVELDPLYADVIIRRYQTATGRRRSCGDGRNVCGRGGATRQGGRTGRTFTRRVVRADGFRRCKPCVDGLKRRPTQPSRAKQCASVRLSDIASPLILRAMSRVTRQIAPMLDQHVFADPLIGLACFGFEMLVGTTRRPDRCRPDRGGSRRVRPAQLLTGLGRFQSVRF
jgi:DNA modification methylase